MWRPIERLLRSFSISELKDVLKGVNKRKLQQEIDVHQLYLFTTWLRRYQETRGQVSEKAIEELTEHAMAIGFQRQLDAVQHNIRRQLLHMSSLLHSSLLELGDAAAAASRLQRLQNPPTAPLVQPYQPGSGLAMAAPPQVVEAERPAPASPPVSMQQLSEVMRAKLDYSVSVAPSEVQHQEAGNGLFVQGKVLPGTVVALFPGVTYFKTHYRQMPNYPKVDRDNPYLVARYDGGVLDSKPWGFGQNGDANGQWPVQTSPVASQLKQLEGRHPLAMAHYANHPGKGTWPNAMVASYTFKLEEGQDAAPRAYFPCVDYSDSYPPDHLLSDTAHAVVLVATKQMSDGEEVLFNYRLSPGLGHPPWYVPVDEREEDRRWA